MGVWPGVGWGRFAGSVAAPWGVAKTGAFKAAMGFLSGADSVLPGWVGRVSLPAPDTGGAWTDQAKARPHETAMNAAITSSVIRRRARFRLAFDLILSPAAVPRLNDLSITV